MIKNRKHFSNVNPIALFLIFILIYGSSGSLFFAAYLKFFDKPLESLAFGYGALIDAIKTKNEFRVWSIRYPQLSFTAHRQPFIPYFLLLLESFLPNKLYLIQLVKNLLFSLVLFASLQYFFKYTNAALRYSFLFFVLTFPMWTLNFFEVGMEEPYLIPFYALVFGIMFFEEKRTLKTSTFWILTLSTFLLFFLKNTMIYVCISIPFLFYFKFRIKSKSLILLGTVLLSILSSAFFNYQNNHHFTVNSTWAGWNLYKGNNEYVINMYPPYHLDILDDSGKIRIEQPVKDEWEYDAYYKSKAISFIKNNPMKFVRLSLRKFFVFFIEVRDSGLKVGEKRMASSIKIINAFYMVFFRIILLAVLIYCILCFFKKNRNDRVVKDSLIYITFILLYAGFYVIGFAYERHVMPIVIPTLMYFTRLPLKINRKGDSREEMLKSAFEKRETVEV